ncbi:Murein DD-endopeptidase MepM [termite gut metagenome]|uniref:Murein DD-endopeptidase MepM n=1 Tax=termite gut metagenome TaxID=433724 RepID=A0A5J4QIF5_9ZZZZ
MHHYYSKLIIAIILAIASADSFSQDLLARQAPIDKRLKAIDSLALQNILEVEHKNFLLTDLYPEWSNKYVHLYGKGTVIPDSFVIDLTGFCMPTSHTQITSPFGPRRRRMHNGLDIKVYTSDTIVAAFDGKVRMVNTEWKGYGKYVVIRHQNGLETVYAHLSKQLVKENQDVKAGEIIGLGGNTGRSYGSHLHFETRFLGIAINPAFMFDFPKQDVVADSYIFKNKNRKSGANINLAGDGTIQYHIIKQGDTLSKIALKRGVSVEMLCRLNRITKNTILQLGQILRCS